MKQMSRICVVGAGLSGAVVARELAEAGIEVLLVDQRDHVAGNCHTKRDTDTGILVHVYGPHIFHTNDLEVWKYFNRFAEMIPFINRVKVNHNGLIYSFPINLHTINQFFGRAFGPKEARDFLEKISRPDNIEPDNFKEQGMLYLGEKMYFAFFHGYTKKQWGVEPEDLPSSIIKRIPVRFDYNDNYYNDRYQAIPKLGYTDLVLNILSHRKIEKRLNCQFGDLEEDFAHVFYSGTIDGYFRYDRGRLKYRTLEFDEERHAGDFQGNAVINYTDLDVPYTRVTEHKHLAPWEAPSFDRTLIYKEFSRDCKTGDVPFYPMRLAKDKELLAEYQDRTRQVQNTTFIGRLGRYQYLDMDKVVRDALDTSRRFLRTNGINTMDWKS